MSKWVEAQFPASPLCGGLGNQVGLGNLHTDDLQAQVILWTWVVGFVSTWRSFSYSHFGPVGLSLINRFKTTSDKMFYSYANLTFRPFTMQLWTFAKIKPLSKSRNSGALICDRSSISTWSGSSSTDQSAWRSGFFFQVNKWKGWCLAFPKAHKKRIKCELCQFSDDKCCADSDGREEEASCRMCQPWTATSRNWSLWICSEGISCWKTLDCCG